jgi:formylglycine-generating enzyme required for sulfatase activity
MFACKKTLNSLRVISCLLILLSSLLCLSYSHAQQAEEDSRNIERLGEGSGGEWEMNLALPTAGSSNSSNEDASVLPDAEQDLELQRLLSKLATNPGSVEVLSQLNSLLADVLIQAGELMDQESIEDASRLLSIILSIDPGFSGLKPAQRRLQVLREADDLMNKGSAAFEAQQVIEPEGENALFYFKRALLKNPESSSIQLGLARVQEALILRANDSAQELDFEMATEWLEQASTVRDDQSLVDEARGQLMAFQNMRADDLENKTLKAIDDGKFSVAGFSIIDLIAMGGQEERVKILQAQLEDARFYGGFEPGQIISDSFLSSSHKAPDIVVISAGSFVMGSGGRSGAYDNETPRHRVTIERGFGFGVREVTVQEFGLFVQRSGYRTQALRAGGSTIYDESAGRLNRRDGVNWKYDYRGKPANPEDPVLHVNLHDARAYVQWLAEQTGKRYRLPSEAEFEYVARAAGRATYWWGEGSPKKSVENLTGSRDSSPSKRRWTTPFKKYGDGHWGPAPAGSLQDNALIHPMGVYDIAGNVSEWLADCWHQNYVKAPLDGSAWVNPGCQRTVVRGGYWASAPEQTRAAFRISAKPDTLGPVVGIRIARDL